MFDFLGPDVHAAGSCSVTYTPAKSGKSTVESSHSGDGNNMTSFGSATVTSTKPYQPT